MSETTLRPHCFGANHKFSPLEPLLTFTAVCTKIGQHPPAAALCCWGVVGGSRPQSGRALLLGRGGWWSAMALDVRCARRGGTEQSGAVCGRSRHKRPIAHRLPSPRATRKPRPAHRHAACPPHAPTPPPHEHSHMLRRHVGARDIKSV